LANITKLAVLLDPDKEVVGKVFDAVTDVINSYPNRGEKLPLELWVGSSHDFGGNVRRYLGKLYDQQFHENIAIVIFPGHPFQLSRNADWIMYPALLNNHSLLLKIIEKIGKVYCWSFKTIVQLFGSHFPELRPFGYYVVDNKSSVGRKLKAKAYSQEEAFRIIKEKFNPKWSGVYCEGGSGASESIAEKDKLLTKVKSLTKQHNKTVYVGGGITNEEEIKSLCNIGVDVIVVSTAFEDSDEPKKLIRNFLDSIKNFNVKSD